MRQSPHRRRYHVRKPPWPLPSTDTSTHHYPLYVSLIHAHEGALTFAQAYAIPDAERARCASPLPALIESWRSEEAYWLRSRYSTYARTALCDVLSLSNTADVPLEEYFLRADPNGSIHAALYDVIAAMRPLFTIA